MAGGGHPVRWPGRGTLSQGAADLSSSLWTGVWLQELDEIHQVQVVSVLISAGALKLLIYKKGIRGGWHSPYFNIWDKLLIFPPKNLGKLLSRPDLVLQRVLILRWSVLDSVLWSFAACVPFWTVLGVEWLLLCIKKLSVFASAISPRI